MNDSLTVERSGKHLRMVWKGVNDGMVYNDDHIQLLNSTSSLLHEVKKLSSMQDPILRYLSIQSYHLFESIQNLDTYDLEMLTKKSREYRAILAECEDQIVNEINVMDAANNTDDEKYSFLTAHCNIIRDYQMLWHLAEIFFIKISAGGFLIQDLQGWLNLQQPHVTSNYNSLIEMYNNSNGDIELETNESYWSTVLSLALHGRKPELTNLLVCHTLSNGQAMRALRNVIETMPVFDEDFSKSPHEFELYWQRWHASAYNALVDSCLLTPYPQMALLADIILGQKSAFLSQTVVELAHGCWYYAVVPFLLYSRPLIVAKDVGNASADFRRDFLTAAAAMEDAPAEECDESILMAVSAAMRLDLGPFLGAISSCGTTGWLPAHLTDLIWYAGPHLLPGPLPPLSGSLQDPCPPFREALILQYALQLATSPALVLTALGYLHACPQAGHAVIHNLVDHLDFPSDRLALRMHNWCEQRGMPLLAQAVSRRRAAACLRGGDPGGSLAWAWRGGDSAWASRVAARLLDDVLAGGRTHEALLQTVRAVAVRPVGKKMALMARVLDLIDLVDRGQLTEAASLVAPLLQAQLLPGYRAAAVVRRCVLPLLAGGREAPLLSTAALLEAMEALEAAPDDGDALEVQEMRRMIVVELSRVCVL